jgi:hypothetical protein
MTASARYQWRRDKDGLGVWEHRGLVAVAGVGHSPVDRRCKPSPQQPSPLMGEGWEGVMQQARGRGRGNVTPTPPSPIKGEGVLGAFPPAQAKR